MNMRESLNIIQSNSGISTNKAEELNEVIGDDLKSLLKLINLEKIDSIDLAQHILRTIENVHTRQGVPQNIAIASMYQRDDRETEFDLAKKAAEVEKIKAQTREIMSESAKVVKYADAEFYSPENTVLQMFDVVGAGFRTLIFGDEGELVADMFDEELGEVIMWYLTQQYEFRDIYPNNLKAALNMYSGCYTQQDLSSSTMSAAVQRIKNEFRDLRMPPKR